MYLPSFLSSLPLLFHPSLLPSAFLRPPVSLEEETTTRLESYFIFSINCLNERMRQMFFTSPQTIRTTDFNSSRRELLEEISLQAEVLDRVSGLLLERNDDISARDRQYQNNTSVVGVCLTVSGLQHLLLLPSSPTVFPKAQRTRDVLLFWEDCVSDSSSLFCCHSSSFSRSLKKRYTHKVKAKQPGQSEKGRWALSLHLCLLHADPGLTAGLCLLFLSLQCSLSSSSRCRRAVAWCPALGRSAAQTESLSSSCRCIWNAGASWSWESTSLDCLEKVQT